MRLPIAVIALALVASACSSFKPIPIAAGDVCFRCRRTIDDPRIAVELIDAGGRAYKFRTTGCLATYLKQHPDDTGTIFVTDYTTGRMLQARSATFVPVMLRTGMSRTPDFIAFENAAAAREVASREGSTPTNWAGVIGAMPSTN